jgi:hypothetical protein
MLKDYPEKQLELAQRIVAEHLTGSLELASILKKGTCRLRTYVRKEKGMLETHGVESGKLVSQMARLLPYSEQQTLTGEKNMILTVTAFIRPREESEVYETLQRSINAFLANMKRSGFQAEVEMPTLTLRITLKSITLPNL